MSDTRTIVDELKWRGMLYDATEGAADVLTKERVAVYNGFDPTANSLHVGSLVPMIGLARLQRFGHTPIALAGGGTGMVGDPSGRSEERNLLTEAQINENLAGIKVQLASVLDFEVKSNPAQLVNNADWLAQLNLLDFLRDVGKEFTVNYMLAKDSVKSRLERDEGGISFTEFSYMLLQSYDFLHLFDHHGCVMQAGGSDQWGNITAGVQLIRRVRGARAYGICYPLITMKDGSKFGKTASGTVWLDPARTSPYRFFQFWLNTADADVVSYLKIFTWLDEPAVDELARKADVAPEERAAQRTLARLMTDMVHGPTALARAEQATEVLFGGDLSGLSADDIADVFAEVPSSELPRSALSGDGLPIADLLVHSGLVRSKGEARRDISGGGINLNNARVAGAERTVTTADSIEGRFVVLRKGRRRFHLVRLLAD